MYRRGFTKLAFAGALALSLTGCCALGGPMSSGEGADGPTLRAGFVRITKNAPNNVVAFYANDKNNVAIQYWATGPGGLPIQTTVGDKLTYEFIDEPLPQSWMDMCNNGTVRAEFPACEVTTVTLQTGAANTCPDLP